MKTTLWVRRDEADAGQGITVADIEMCIRDRYNTKREAIARAKTIAKNQRSSVYVLGNDGHISEQFAY